MAKKIEKKLEWEDRLLNIAIDILSNIDLYKDDDIYPVDITISYNSYRKRWEIELG